MHEPKEFAVLSELTGLRRLVSLTSTIITLLILVNIATHAWRIYLIESRLRPMQVKIEKLQEELRHAKHT